MHPTVGRTPWSAAGPLAGSFEIASNKRGTRASRAVQGDRPTLFGKEKNSLP